MIDENGRREIDIKRYARFEKVCCENLSKIFAYVSIEIFRSQVVQSKNPIYLKVPC